MAAKKVVNPKREARKQAIKLEAEIIKHQEIVDKSMDAIKMLKAHKKAVRS